MRGAAVRIGWQSWVAVPLLCLGLLAGLVADVHAQAVQPVPALSGHVVDQAQILSPVQRSQIEAQLTALEAELGSQLVVLTVTSTAPEDMASYAQRIGDSWKIGRKDVGDGLLLVIASGDRRVRIEVAKSLEGAIPDLAASRVINGALTPAFKRGDYAGGIGAAIDQLRALIRGEALPTPNAPQDRSAAGDGFGLQELAMLALVGVPIAARLLSQVFGRRIGVALTAVALGGLAGTLSASVWIGLLAALIGGMFALVVGVIEVLRPARHGGVSIGGLGGSGHGGFGDNGGFGGGSGDGGFSSGGGGNFGGGGASGRW